MEANEFTPLSDSPVPQATAAKELSADMELAAIEGRVAIARDVSPDHPDVSPKELWGWYMFEFASQPYATAALVVYLPLILEDLAWRAGTSNPLDPLRPPCEDRSTISASETGDCFVDFFGGWIPPVSFTLYVTAISVVLQVLVFISCGALADYSRWRKVLLIAFSTVSALTCLGFLTVIKPEWYILAAILTIISNVTFGTAMVFYYAYLPLLADAHPSVRKVKSEIERELYEIDLSSQQGPGHRLHSPKAIERDADGIEMHTIIENGRKTSIVTRTPSQLDLAREGATRRLYLQRETVSNLISTNSFSISYFGGVTALVLTAVFLFAMKSSSTYLMQVCVAFCGLWWYAQSVNRMRVMTEPKTILTRLAFMLSFTLPWLKTRPGPQLPPKEKSYFLYSWKKTFQTFRRAAKLRNTFFFLLSWALYADAYSTIAAVAVLFGKSALNMTNSQLVLVAGLGPLAAIPGNYFFLFIFSRWLKWTNKSMLILLITLMSLIPLYGSLGFWIPESSGLGVRSVNEMYVLGAFYGFLLGALQSFSRVFYADFIPPGMESEFFALYEITDKGSSWLGPLMVAVVTDWLGNIRYGFVVIFLMLLLGLIPLVLLNVERGQSDARNFTIDVLANSDDDTETMVEPVAARGRANDEEVVNWQQI